MTTKSFALAEVKAATTDDPNGAFEAILSVNSLDRDNEIIEKGAFGNLPAHITIDVDHGLSMASTIGSGTPYYDGDTLKIKGTFASIPRAQEARALVTEGHITSMSVAFIPKEKVKGKAAGDPTRITKAELLNAAFVSIPANRDALVLSAKAGARNSATDASYIQTIHDAAMALGAECGAGKAFRDGSTKAVAGSYEDRQEDIREALVEANLAELQRLHPNSDPDMYYVSIVATFDDHVVYRMDWSDDDAAWSAPYTWDGEEVTIGTPTAVSVDQVVTPSSDSDASTRSVNPRTAAAKAAAKSSGNPEAEQFMLRVRALRLAAEVA